VGAVPSISQSQKLEGEIEGARSFLKQQAENVRALYSNL